MFTNIMYKATNVELEASWKILVEQKFSGLEKYFKDGDEVLCEVEFEKETAHQSGNHYRMEANLTVNGKLFRAEDTNESFEKAVDEVQAELDKLLRKANEKEGTLFKKGGRMLKQLMHTQ